MSRFYILSNLRQVYNRSVTKKALILSVCSLFFWIGSFGQNEVYLSIFNQNAEPLTGAHVQIEQDVYVSDEQGVAQIDRTYTSDAIVKITALGFVDFSGSWLDISIDTKVILESDEYTLKEVAVLASGWVDDDEPFTTSHMSDEDIEALNLGQDIPLLLQNQPSLTYTTDAGNGIGYSAFRIRGSDATRINISIDGIPLNEAESQAVFWVDLPDFASSTDQIQIQRGVGPSSNGTGVFGATVNLLTEKYSPEPYMGLSASLGSFNSQKYTAKFGTGNFMDNWSFVGRASLIKSDGYIDRATSDLHSFYGALTKLDNRSFTNLKVFYGHEETYQAWNGVPYQRFHQLGQPTFNTAGEISEGVYYDNQIDNYRQTHVHLIHEHHFDSWDLSIKGHYTDGGGYFEEYERDETLSDFGLEGEDSDLVRRRWLRTDYAGLILTADYLISEKLNSQFGLSTTYYEGDHYGEVIDVISGTDASLPSEYYRNEALKRDFAAFLILKQQLTDKLNTYIDLQYRGLSYDYQGFDNSGDRIDRTTSHHFFNPKAGLNYKANTFWRLYISAALAHKEPNRNDFIDAEFNEDPQPEQLLDIEFGSEWTKQNWQLAMNLFGMFYHDQLVLTGELNDVGEYIRTNVDRSHRIGLELSGQVQASNEWTVLGNMTISQNRISEFNEFRDNWETAEQDQRLHLDTDLAFSPSFISFAGVQYRKMLANDWNLTSMLGYKYVGKQFLDNTSSDSRSLKSYGSLNLNGAISIPAKWANSLQLKFMVNNILDESIVSNGWSYAFRSPSYDPVPDDVQAISEGDGNYALIGLYPQAGINFMIGVDITF